MEKVREIVFESSLSSVSMIGNDSSAHSAHGAIMPPLHVALAFVTRLAPSPFANEIRARSGLQPIEGGGKIPAILPEHANASIAATNAPQRDSAFQSGDCAGSQMERAISPGNGHGGVVYVATDLSFFVMPGNGDVPSGITREGVVYRKLDLRVYAWLSKRVVAAASACDRGRLRKEQMDAIDAAFSPIRSYAEEHGLALRRYPDTG